jgi:hypothetical protein
MLVIAVDQKQTPTNPPARFLKEKKEKTSPSSFLSLSLSLSDGSLLFFA